MWQDESIECKVTGMTTPEAVYGMPPVPIVYYPLLEWDEYMHWLYCPVEQEGLIRFPANLTFLTGMYYTARSYLFNLGFQYKYGYITARRGWATPDNPINRPGWHTDGFGTADRNFIWWSNNSTRFAIQKFENISEDHTVSMQQFEEQVREETIVTFPDQWLMLLDPFVVHTTPEIASPGCERAFVKISFSNQQYNLKGNSHNYLFDYDWPMHDRSLIRNDPHQAGKDYYT